MLLTLRILSKVVFDFVMNWYFASWSHCCCWPSAVAGIPDVDGVPWFCWRSESLQLLSASLLLLESLQLLSASLLGVPAVAGFPAVASSQLLLQFFGN